MDKVRDLYACDHVRNSCVASDKESSSQVKQFVFADSSVALADYLIHRGHTFADRGMVKA